VLIALGQDPTYVMGQMGHTDPTVTLGLYAKVMQVSDADGDRLRDLVAGRTDYGAPRCAAISDLIASPSRPSA
jgi:hypothetical protein